MSNRSGMRLQYSPSGIYTPQYSNVNRFLPQGGFQSVNASITAQEQCRVIPQMKTQNLNSMDNAGSMFGYGSQDVYVEKIGNNDVVDLSTLNNANVSVKENDINLLIDVNANLHLNYQQLDKQLTDEDSSEWEPIKSINIDEENDDYSLQIP